MRLHTSPSARACRAGQRYRPLHFLDVPKCHELARERNSLPSVGKWHESRSAWLTYESQVFGLVTVYPWMDGWMDGWMDAWMPSVWFGRCIPMNECMHVCMDAWMHAWTSIPCNPEVLKTSPARSQAEQLDLCLKHRLCNFNQT